VKTKLDLLDSASGWTLTGSVSASVNGHPEFIADALTGSLVVHFPAGSKGRGISKVLDVDASGCSEVTLSVWSRYFRGTLGLDPAEHRYSIAFEATKAYCLPLPYGFDSVDFGIDGWTKATKLEVLALTDDEDWLVLSACYAVKEDLPLDLYSAVKAGIAAKVLEVAGKGIPLGKVTCAAGAESITLEKYDYVDRYCTVLIDDGASSETHQVNRYDRPSLWFGAAGDGTRTKYAHAAADTYLVLPVDFGVEETEAIVPGVSIYGMATADAQTDQDTFTVIDTLDLLGGAAARRVQWLQEYDVFVDCEARHSYVLALLGRAARRWMAGSVLWVDGRKLELECGDGDFVEPDSAVNAVPKLQYHLKVKVREERAGREYLPATVLRTLTYTPSLGVV
jgi:hypothetical protein